LRIHYELDISTKREKIVNQIMLLSNVVDKFNVPDNPMGHVKANSLAVSILLKQLGLEPVMHLRVIDRNLLALKSEIYGAKLFNIKEVLLVKGDLPEKDKLEIFNDSKLENVLEYLKSDDKIQDIKLGLPLTNYKLLTNLTLRRVESKADFFVTTQVSSIKEINEEIIKTVRKNNKELHCYYVVATDKNKDLLYKFGLIRNNKLLSFDEYLSMFEDFENYLDALILSSPLDVEYLYKLLIKYRKR